ncbi:MAG: hypothetical protein WBO09_16915 [Methylocystis silviterrae]|uniref:hypothetical protein n=1 Tax=Methylocystis silviterrae TaxID=2743612 RepID=UPI003C740900
MGYAYSIHGLRVHVDSLWPELTAWKRHSDSGEPDVRVRLKTQLRQLNALSRLSWRHRAEFDAPREFDSVDEHGMKPRAYIECAEAEAGEYFRASFTYGRSTGIFIIGPGGADIWVSWEAAGERESLVRRGIATLLQGCVWGILLRIRGIVWLHGNAISIGGKSIILLGHSGAGKSTLSAAFAMSNATILADDKAVIVRNGAELAIKPGGSHLRLCPDSLAALQWPTDSLACEGSKSGKRRVTLADSHRAEPPKENDAQLNAIYILEPREQALRSVEIEPLAPVVGLWELLNYHCGLLAAPIDHIAREYMQLSDIAGTVPIRRLRRPDDTRWLPHTVSAIIGDLRTDAVSQ